jgi:hypothetical protein
MEDRESHALYAADDVHGLVRRLRAMPAERARLRAYRGELDALILDTLRDTTSHLGLERSDEQELGRMYLESVTRLGLV